MQPVAFAARGRLWAEAREGRSPVCHVHSPSCNRRPSNRSAATRVSAPRQTLPSIAHRSAVIERGFDVDSEVCRSTTVHQAVMPPDAAKLKQEACARTNSVRAYRRCEHDAELIRGSWDQGDCATRIAHTT
jgi:hypothetical protein